MKVWTSKYRNHWVSPYTILKTICFWEKDEDRIYNLKEEPNNPYVRWVNFLDPICTAWMKFLDFVHPRWNYVRLDPWDTWSFDHTLADIILPGLKQLRATKHGAPFVDDEDVPEGMNLRSTEAEPKENEWVCVPFIFFGLSFCATQVHAFGNIFVIHKRCTMFGCS